MKIFKYLVIALCVVACSSDGVDSDNVVESEVLGLSDSEVAELESTVLNVDTVAAELIFEINKENSNVSSVLEVVEKEVPAVDTSLSIELPSETQTAFLNVGLTLEIRGNQNFDGVYLRVKDINGNKSNSIYKIELQSNGSVDEYFTSVTKTNIVEEAFFNEVNVSNINSVATTDVFFEDVKKTIDIDFTEEMEPGVFCYEICAYIEGNDGVSSVSAPSDVCVQVEAWGGNSAIVSDWNFNEIKFINISSGELYERASWVNNVEKTYSLQEKDCNGNLLETPKDLKRLINVTKYSFKGNGEFISEDYGYQDYDYFYDENNEYQCSDLLIRESYSHVLKGKWTYSQSSGLSVIYTEIIRTVDGVDEDRLKGQTDSFHIKEAVVSLSGDSMKISRGRVSATSPNRSELYLFK